jgi:hypothetical protein
VGDFSSLIGRKIDDSGGVRGIARNAWDDIKTSARDVFTRPNSPDFEVRTARAGMVGAVTSIAGGIGHSLTGRHVYQDVAGVGEVISGSADLVGLRGNIVNLAHKIKGVNDFAGNATKVSGLAAATGVLSIAAGGYTLATQAPKAWKDYSDDGQLSKEGKMAAINSFAGALSALGGFAMVIPGGQALGAVALGVSGAISAGAWVYENWDRLTDGARAYQGVVENGKKIVTHYAQRAKENVTRTVKEGARRARDWAAESARKARQSISTGVQNVTRSVKQAADSVSGVVGNAKTAVGNLVGGLFGGG